MQHSRWRNLGMLSVVAILALALVPSHAAVSNLVVGSYQLVSSTRVTRTLFDFTYRAALTNTGNNSVPGVTATLTSTNPATTVIDNSLTFGVIPGGAGTQGTPAVQSLDTFTIRQDRTLPFNPAALVWTLNQHPQANAGADQTATVGTVVQLDGSASSDLDGDELTLQWTLLTKPPGSTATLSSTTAVQPTFTVDKAGTYEIQLIVNDGTLNSAPDTVKISTTNSAPSANAGPDQTVPLGSLVTLDGSGSSDPDNDALTYDWSLVTVPQGSAATLAEATTERPTFTADKPGAYHVRLVVNDGTVESTEDIVIVSTENSAPVANAGPDLEGVVNQPVQLDSNASSDVDGDSLSYQWSFVSVPDTSNVILSDTTIANPTFTPDVAGMYVV